MAEPLPVLMYHGIHPDSPDPARGRFDPVYSVDAASFAAQLDWLRDHDYDAILLGDLDAPPTNGRRRVVITFDDGDKSNAEVALPLLRERGQHAEFFVTSDFVDQTGMLAAADVRALADAGMGVQSHGRSHRFLADLDAVEMRTELEDSRQRLQAMSGRAVTALALPGGRGGERERVEALALGYRHVLNSMPGPNTRRLDGHYLERVAVTRGLDLDAFAELVEWRGLRPRLSRLRFEALALPKRVLGNAAYERLRAALLRS